MVLNVFRGLALVLRIDLKHVILGWCAVGMPLTWVNRQKAETLLRIVVYGIRWFGASLKLLGSLLFLPALTLLSGPKLLLPTTTWLLLLIHNVCSISFTSERSFKSLFRKIHHPVSKISYSLSLHHNHVLILSFPFTRSKVYRNNYNYNLPCFLHLHSYNTSPSDSILSWKDGIMNPSFWGITMICRAKVDWFIRTE